MEQNIKMIVYIIGKYFQAKKTNKAFFFDNVPKIPTVKLLNFCINHSYFEHQDALL